MAAYETEDGEPRYGKRLSPEELAAHLREQGIEPPAGPGSAAVPRAGAASTSRAPGGSAPRRAGRRRPLGVGLVLMAVVAPLALVAGVVLAVDGPLTRGASLDEAGLVYLEAGTTAGLYGTSATATAGCAVNDPDGVPVILDVPEAGVPYASFTPAHTGVYTVSCPAGTTGLVVGPALRLDRIPAAAALLLGAGVVGVAGLVTTVVGVLRARR